MKLQLDRTHVLALAGQFPALSGGLQGRTVAEMLASKGFLKETPELLAAYDASVARYFEWRGRYGAQFAGHGVAFIAEDPSATHRLSPQERDWSRKDQVILSAAGGAARLVNDEGILPPRSTGLESPGDILAPYLRRATKSSDYDCEEEVKAPDASLPKHLFTQLPVQAYLFLFHLELHQHLWVHVDDIAPYVYQPELKHKLVLPPEQTELIDILTAEMDVLQDDVVAGKGGGTTVVCAGPPGVGKTLTADVYIRKRSDDIAANAVQPTLDVFARCAMFRALDAHMTEAH